MILAELSSLFPLGVALGLFLGATSAVWVALELITVILEDL